MQKVKWLVLSLLCVCAVAASAQKKKKSKSSSSVEPYYPTKVYSPKISKKKSIPTTFKARDKYTSRLRLLRRKAKVSEMEHAMRASDYDLPYFGHRKQPKKRPPEKMKYCKICGIRH